MDSIKAYTRIKPSDQTDEPALEKLDEHHVLARESQETFEFERVFGEQASNNDVFEEVICKNWENLCKGLKSRFNSFSQRFQLWVDGFR